MGGALGQGDFGVRAVRGAIGNRTSSAGVSYDGGVDGKDVGHGEKRGCTGT